MSSTTSFITQTSTSDTHTNQEQQQHAARSLQTSENTERQEEAWPGDRNPSENDAADAYSPLELDLDVLPTFRNAVLAESQSRARPTVAGIDTIHGILSRSMTIDPLFWPMGMFALSATPVTVLDQLVNQCCDGFLQKVVFLRDVPVSSFVQSPRPQYLTLALAAMGSLLAGDASDVSARYWQESVRLMTGRLEIDNREARNFNLLKAWLLLETYATLSSDHAVWKQANMAHGYVETAVSRLIRQDQLHLRDTDPPKEAILDLLSYFRLIDLLRAIHYNQPATFAGSIASGDARFQHLEPAKRAVLQLIDIFADAHALRIIADGGTEETASTLYAPLSFDSELQKSQETVLAQLMAWKESHFDAAADDVRLLFLFCHMYLLSDNVQHLITSSGYRNQSQHGRYQQHEGLGRYRRRQYQDTRLASLLDDEKYERNALAVSCAWRILDTSESLGTAAMSMPLPPWAPLAVFAAALVVSTDLLLLSPDQDGNQDRSQDKDRMRANARQLRSFNLEIEQMNVPCAKRMADILVEMQHQAP